jgi:glucose-6-phosphate 1-dehydrogenase
VLQFKDVPHRLFRHAETAPNRLVLRLQPDEGIALRFDVKPPGPSARLRPADLEFRFETSFQQESPEAYERLILDSLLGDSTLFIRRDEVEASWRWIDGLHEGWAQEGDVVLPDYTSGTDGPAEADVMLAQDGRKWKRL